MRPLDATAFIRLIHGLTCDLTDRFVRRRELGPRCAFLALAHRWLTKLSLMSLAGALYADRLTTTQVAPSSLCRAFAKLDQRHIQAVLERTGSALRRYQQPTMRRLRRLRLPGRVLAIDGSMLVTPLTADTAAAFGRPRCANQRSQPTESHFPQARLVVLYDVARQLPIAWTLGPCRGAGGETAAATELLRDLQPGDVVLLDRGFNSWDLLQAIRQRGAYFCLRARRGRQAWRCIQAFDADKRTQGQAMIGHGPEQWSVRLLRSQTRLATEDMILITNMPGNRQRICDAYGLRWAVEGFFRQLKIAGRIENFSGRSRQAVWRDVAIACFIFQAIAVLELCVAPSTAWAIGDAARLVPRTALLHVLTAVLRRCWNRAQRWHATRTIRIIQQLSAQAPKRRPGRRFPRVCKSRYGRWRTPECLRH